MGTLDFLRLWVQAHLPVRSERGASLVEYALLLALIAVVCVVAVTAMGSNLSDSYDESNNSMFSG